MHTLLKKKEYKGVYWIFTVLDRDTDGLFHTWYSVQPVGSIKSWKFLGARKLSIFSNNFQ